MKLPITDKFLWDVYSILSALSDVVDFTLMNDYQKARVIRGDENPVFRKYQKEMGKREFSKLVYYLKRKNYIKVQDLKGKKALMMTKEGISKALQASFFAQGKRKRKDGKWIMIIFDIPQKHRKARSLLMSILYNLGYKLLQQSVWVTPYDVSEKTEELLQIHSLDGYVKIFLIEKI